MVGWVPIAGGENETVDQVAFGVVRLHVDLTQPFATRNFYFNYTTDVLTISMNRFTIFNSFYKYFFFTPHFHYCF